MILITMILTTMDFMVLGGGTVGAVDGGEDPVVGTIEVEEDIEVEGVMGLIVVDLVEVVDLVVVVVDLVEEVEEVVDLVEEVEEVVDLVEEVEAEAVVEVEEAGVVVNHTSMIF
jgi:hypothetical protein